MKFMGIFLLAVWLSVVSGQAPGTIRYRWKTPVYEFPDQTAESEMLANGSYVPGTGIIIDVDRHEPTDRTFVTLPSLNSGLTKVTLATISNSSQVDDPLLAPYPNWSWNQGQCDGLASVFRVKVDRCNRLWVVDSGVVTVIDSFNRTCPAKLVIFDLNTDTPIKTYEFPDNVLQDGNLLINIQVEISPDSCDDAYAYIADSLADTLVVYSLANNNSWWVNSTSFYADSDYANITISNVTFSIGDGLFALALSPRTSNGDHQLFYHSPSSICENYVYTSVLKNESNFVNGTSQIPDAFHACFATRSGQSAAETMDSNGNLFSSGLSNNSIQCWNWQDANYTSHVAMQNDTTLQFPSGMKSIPTPRGDEIWASTNRFEIIATTGLNTSEYNFHIVSGSANVMAADSGCKPNPQLPSNNTTNPNMSINKNNSSFPHHGNFPKFDKLNFPNSGKFNFQNFGKYNFQNPGRFNFQSPRFYRPQYPNLLQQAHHGRW